MGGHGHSHGPEGHDHGHDHGHDELRAAEEGHGHAEEGHTHAVEQEVEEGNAGEVFPEAVLAKVKSNAAQPTRLTKSVDESGTGRGSTDSNRPSSVKSHRRHPRVNFDDLSIHPASFRQEIIAASRSQLDSIESGDNTESEVEPVEEHAATENSPLLGKPNGKSHAHRDHSTPRRPRGDSWHASHNHNKPKKANGGHGHSHGDMGMNAMVLHVIGDALGNIGVIVSALVIWLTEWSGKYYADPVVSLFITLIILKSTIPLTSATAKILLQATPDHIDVKDVKEDIEDIPGVISCHHMHIWQLSDTQLVASMHIQVSFPIGEANGSRYMELARSARKCLHAYGIHSATMQPEFCLDRAHNHTPEPVTGLDGVSRPSSPPQADACLLECVENCEAKGCCSSSRASSHHAHSEDDHTH